MTIHEGCDWVRNANAASLSIVRAPWLDAPTLPDGLAGSAPVFYGNITCFEKNCHGDGTALAQCVHVTSCIEGGLVESDSARQVATPIIEFANGHIITQDVMVGAFTISLTLEFVSTAAATLRTSMTSASPATMSATQIAAHSLTASDAIPIDGTLVTSDATFTNAAGDSSAIGTSSNNTIGIIAGAATGGVLCICCALLIAFVLFRSRTTTHALPNAHYRLPSSGERHLASNQANLRGSAFVCTIEPIISARAMSAAQPQASSATKYSTTIEHSSHPTYGAFEAHEI